MQVFRLCKDKECELILKNRNFEDVGQEFHINSQKNTHQYLPNVKYMHFFENEISLLYLAGYKENYIFVYDIPDEILKSSKGQGFYLDFINFSSTSEATEYAIDTKQMKFAYMILTH